MGNKCEHKQNSGREAEATSRGATAAAPLPVQVVEQIAQLVKEWNLGESGSPTTAGLLYLRADQVIQVLPISRRCLSNWQARRLIKFYRVKRTILFRRSDIEACLEKFAVNPIGEPKPRRQHVEAGRITSQPKALRKRRAGRIQPESPLSHNCHNEDQ